MPFVKGQVTNPNGRPKYSITEGLERELAKIDPKSKVSKAHAIARVAVGLAMKGELEAIKYINNRTEGMPKAHTDITTGGKPITNPLLGNLLDNVPAHDSDPEASQTSEAN